MVEALAPALARFPESARRVRLIAQPAAFALVTPIRPPAATPDGAPPTDEALISAIAQGDLDAFGALYDRHHRRAFAIAYRVLEEQGAAEDAVQDAFLAVWQRAASFAPERGSVAGWFNAVVRHAAIDHGRRSPRTYAPTIESDTAATPADEIAHTVAAGIEAARVRDALTTLPDAQRQVITLAYFGGLSHHEIAVHLGLPLGTVKGRMRLGMHKLRDSLTDLLPDGGGRTED